MTPSYVSLLESGERVPTLDVILHLARTLQLSPQDLIDQRLPDSLVGYTAAPPDDHSQDRRLPVLEQLQIHQAIDVGDFDLATTLMLRVLAEARHADDEERLLWTGVEAHSFLRSLGRHQERLDLLRELSGLATVRGSPQLHVMLLTDLASAQRDAGQLGAARATAEALLLVVRKEGPTGGLDHVRLLGVLISVLCELGETAPVSSLVEDMLAMAARLDRPGFSGRAHWVASMAYAHLGEPEQAYTQLLNARRSLASATLPLADWLRFCRSAASVLLSSTQHFDRAQEWLQEAESTAHRLDLPAERVAVLALRARYEAMTGNLAHALTLYDEYDRQDSSLTGLDLLRVELSRATVLEGLGRHDDAVAQLRAVADRFERIGAYPLAVQVWREVDDLRRRSPASVAGTVSQA